MTATFLDTENMYLDMNRRWWHCYLPGRVLMGNARTRPVQVVGDKAMHASILPPGTGILESGGAGSLTGTVSVAIVYYRKLTNERSQPAYFPDSITLSSESLTIVNEDFAAPSEKYVSHREFYVNVEELGGWFLIGSTEYIGGSYTITFDMTTDQLVNQRPLEDQLQASLYPAVRAATYWNGAVYGTGLEGRTLPNGVTIKLTQGSPFALITGATWMQSDYLKPLIVDGEPLFFIYTQFSDSANTVFIKLPQSTAPGADKWPYATRTITVDSSVYIAGEEQTIYVSPTYVGEAGNGLTRGLVTWNPLNQLRDEYQTSVGSRTTAIIRNRESLVVFFDRAIVTFQGSPSLDVPQPSSVTLSDCIGTLGQQHVWNTRDGSVWWLTRDRIYTLSANEVVDVTAQWGNASLFSRHFDTYFTSNYYNWTVAYNPKTNQTLIANLAEHGASDDIHTRAEKAGRSALLIDHNRQAFYKLHFPYRIKAVSCCQRRDGAWGWFCLAVPVAQTPETSSVSATYFMEMFTPTADTDNNEINIDWSLTSGSRYSGMHGMPVACSFRMENVQGGQGLANGILVECAIQNANIRNPNFTATFTKRVDLATLKSADWVSLPRAKEGSDIRFRWSGTNGNSFDDPLKIISASILSDVTPLRGFDN